MRHRPEERATGGHPNDREVTQAHHAVDEAAVDEAVEMTFPASDPPAWMSSGSRDATPRDPNDGVARG